MGGGASRRGKKNPPKPEAPPLDISPPVGPLGIEAHSALQALGPAEQRRRKVLFGGVGLRTFETVSPLNQYYANLEEAGDPVFARLHERTANEFRHKAEQFRDHEGLLRENAIELLSLRLGTGSVLSQQLFRVGKAQLMLTKPAEQLPPTQSVPAVGGNATLVSWRAGNPQKRPDKLTCYELLALHSLIKHGTTNELLELLFCIFDVDEDGRVSVGDIELVLEPFLEMGGASLPEDSQEKEDLDKLMGEPKKNAVRKIAENAVSKYGTPAEEDDEEHTADTNVADTMERAANLPTGDAQADETKSIPTEVDEQHGSEKKNEEQNSLEAASTAANPDAAKKKRSNRVGCFGGAKKKSPPNASDSSADEADPQTAANAPKAAGYPKAKAKAKVLPKKRSRSWGSKKSLSARTLGFEQWRRWLQEEKFLPENFGKSATPPTQTQPAQPNLGVAASAPPVDEGRGVGDLAQQQPLLQQPPPNSSANSSAAATTTAVGPTRSSGVTTTIENDGVVGSFKEGEDDGDSEAS